MEVKKTMARQRLTTTAAKISGAALKDKKRFENRKETPSSELGNPSEFLDEFAQRAWEGFKKEMPWLKERDRTHVEIAAILRGRMMSNPRVGATNLNLLRLCISQMGGNPVDATKVGAPDDQEKDPDETYFNN